jgi:hypothetical protein
MRAIQFDGVLERLRQWRDNLVEQMGDPAPRSEDLRLKLQLDDAIACLRLCEKHQIRPDAMLVRLPEPQTRTPSSEYRVVEDQETDGREHWIEVMINGVPLRPAPGSVVVEIP